MFHYCNLFACRATMSKSRERPLADKDFTYEDLARIVELIRGSEQFSEFRLKVGDVELELRRHGAAGAAPLPPAPAVWTNASAADPEKPRVQPGPSAAANWPEGSIVIRSPMVGTFYRSPQPGAPPFVNVGESVEAGTTVCIVEVMKLMNSIPAGARGTVIEVLVDDAAAVEAGQPLIVLEPASP
jgi:acetyl-CoA carboxylase biotin carboxyl carrier protein